MKLPHLSTLIAVALATLTHSLPAVTASNLSSSQIYLANTSLELTDIVVSADGPVTVTLILVNPDAGSLNTGTAGAATSTYDAGTGVWTVSGAVADVNTLLAAVIFTPALDLNASFTIIASVSDGVATVSGAISMTETNGFAPSEFVDPNPNPGNQFGHSVLPLSTGNVVITAPFDDAGGTDAGAVYLFNGATGALISRLIGSSANDNVGFHSVTELGTGNFVASSRLWDNGAATNAGAVTFGSGITGVSGAVSASNSLVGSQANDQVGSGGVTVLSSGNYVVGSPVWDNGAILSAGAATFGSGSTGVSGVVSAGNSLVGSAANDQVGSVFALSNGNYVVRVPSWDNGAILSVGAVTFGSGTTGVSGVVSASNSLVGSTAGDQVGTGVTVLSNGNYVVRTHFWDNGAILDVGAVTFCNGTTGGIGVVSASNSLIGSSASDQVGSDVTALSNGNYVVRSTFWVNGAFKTGGAMTFGNGTTGVSGVVSGSNSLIGSTDGDLVGSSVAVLPNGNYVVRIPSWDNGAVANAGAATFGNGTSGVSGVISASNSLVGSTAMDQVGSSAVTVLSNGKYLVRSPSWDNGPVPDVGAVTFGSGTTGVSGVVSLSNSLVGSTGGDQVGLLVTPLGNGNYVVSTPLWNNGALTDVGAVTFGSGATGVTGVVSESNSLVGSTAGDQVGVGVTALSNGNYVVRSPIWNYGAVTDAGAVTFCSGTTGLIGVVSDSNSLVGSSASDQVGGAVSVLGNGNYVVRSTTWDNGAVTDAGAATFCSGTTGLSGVVSADNSLVGSTASDSVGFGGVFALSNGNYVVRSSLWDNGGATDAGAMTFGSGINGVPGMINSANSSRGEAPNTNLQAPVEDTVNGIFFARFRDEESGKVRVGSVTTGFAPLAQKITVFTGDSTEPEDSRTNGLGTLDFGSLAGGISAAQVFTIRNSGVAALTDLAVSATGVNGGNYAVNTSGMGSSLAPGESATFTVTFAPTATASGLLPALVEIASNDVDDDPFIIPVTGRFFSHASDIDDDGLDDASEFKLSQFGFDPAVNQSELVAALFGNLGGAQTNLNGIGYFTAAQVQALHIDTPMIQRNPGTGEFTLMLGLEKSTTLQPGSFLPFPFTAPGTSINGQGKIKFDFTVPGNAAFFRLQTE